MRIINVRKFGIMLSLVMTLLITVVPGQVVSAAIREITVNENEYNLVIGDTPSFTSEWSSLFAKMNNNRNPEAFTLSMFDDVDSTDSMVSGLEKSGIKVDFDNVLGMDINLYEISADDGEFYPVDKSVDITIICPVPDFWLDTPDKVQLYQLTSSKTAQKFNSSLVSVNGIPCLMFTIKNTGVYGLMLSDSVSSNDIEDKVVTPTVAPTKTPELVETKNTVSNDANQNSRPEANVNGNSKAVTKTLDQTPQTGDEAPFVRWLLTASLSGSGIVAIILCLKRK